MNDKLTASAKAILYDIASERDDITLRCVFRAVSDERNASEPIDLFINPYIARRATVRIRRGDGWPVKPEVEALDGLTHRFTPGWSLDDETLYAGETAWLAERTDWPANAPIWVASGDLEFHNDRCAV